MLKHDIPTDPVIRTMTFKYRRKQARCSGSQQNIMNNAVQILFEWAFCYGYLCLLTSGDIKKELILNSLVCTSIPK